MRPAGLRLAAAAAALGLVALLRIADLMAWQSAPILEALGAAGAALVFADLGLEILPRHAAYLAAGAGVVLSVAIALGAGAAAAASVGLACVAFLPLGHVGTTQATLARAVGLAGAAILDPAVGLVAISAFAWSAPLPPRAIAAWGAGATACASTFAFAPAPERTAAIGLMLIASVAGLFAAPTLARGRIGRPMRQIAFVALGLAPAAAALALVFLDGARDAPWSFAEALGRGALALALGAAAAIAGLGLVVCLSTRTPARPIAIAFLVIDAAALAIMGRVAMPALAIPLALLAGVGALFAIRFAGRRRDSSLQQRGRKRPTRT